jgi:hypothetical protein
MFVIGMITGVLIFIVGLACGIFAIKLYQKYINKVIDELVVNDPIVQTVSITPTITVEPTNTITGQRRTIHTDINTLLHKEDIDG